MKLVNLDQIRTAIDAATAVYTGDPIMVPLDAQVRLRDLGDAVQEYRDMGWTVEYESDPLRLVVS